VEVVDVDSDPHLISRYSEEVPVLLLNGKQISFFTIDIDRVLALLAEI
ncbi:MAG: Glutaredoxin-like domain, partial [Actinomycetota bacterium]